VGFDGISVKILKLVINSIISPLTYIYNLGIKNGIFPKKLKLAIIKPIYKNWDITCINKFRPIFMLSNFSKIMEKIFKNRLIKFWKNMKSFRNSILVLDQA